MGGGSSPGSVRCPELPVDRRVGLERFMSSRCAKCHQYAVVVSMGKETLCVKVAETVNLASIRRGMTFLLISALQLEINYDCTCKMLRTMSYMLMQFIAKVMYD